MKRNSLRHIDEMLRERPRIVPLPRDAHARVMLGVAKTGPGSGSPDGEHRSIGWAKAAACLALATGAVIGWRGLQRPEPGRSETIVAASLDPTPVLLPTARTISDSLQVSLMNEARSVLDDTRRAADFVVSCLPFTGG